MKISVCVIVTGNVKSRKRPLFALHVQCLSCSYGHPSFLGINVLSFTFTNFVLNICHSDFQVSADVLSRCAPKHTDVSYCCFNQNSNMSIVSVSNFKTTLRSFERRRTPGTGYLLHVFAANVIKLKCMLITF